MKTFGGSYRCGDVLRESGLLSFVKLGVRHTSLVMLALFSALACTVRADALTFTVNSLSDARKYPNNGDCDTVDGCTLREAIGEIMAGSDATNTINFSPSLSGTIVLASSLPDITKNLTVNGPGSDRLTIDGQNLYQIFRIDSPGDSSTVSIRNLRLVRGYASSGGGVFAGPGDNLSLTQMVFEDNDAAAFGGAVCCNVCGSLTIAHSRFTNNTATGLGGGAYAGDSSVSVSYSVFEGNVNLANHNGGGGMAVFSGTNSITDCTFEGNKSARWGGGLYFFGVTGGTVTIRDSLLSGNNAVNSGGGIYLEGDGSLVIDRAAFLGNTSFSGGGLYIAGTLAASIANSTISGNSASSLGGGLLVGWTSVVQLSNVTVAQNVADADADGDAFGRGGGIGIFGTLTVQNSMIADNVTLNSAYRDTDDCYNYTTGSVTSGGYNVIGNGQGCTFAGTGDQAGTTASPFDPRLAPLAWNGGATPTHALLSTSPAKDNGNPGGCKWDNDADGGTTPEVPLSQDQRTAVRPYGLRCDVGAYEWSHCDNGVQDNGETGIDCGGSCSPCNCAGTSTAKVIDTGYLTIQAAYDSAWDSALIRARETVTAQKLIFDRAMQITLRGGYDCSFFRIRGMTPVAGLIVASGTLKIENIVIGP